MEFMEDEAEANTEEMLSTARRHADRMQRSALAAFDVFGSPMARAMEQNRAIFQKMVQAVQEESLKFVNRRLEHTSQAIESSRDFQGLAGLMAVQQGWMLDFARDYADQTKRFADLMRELAEDGTANLSEASSAIVESTEAETERHHAAA